MNANLAASALITFAALCAPLAHAAPLFEQQVLGGDNVGSSWTSHFAVGVGGYQTLDDFKLAADARVDRVRWHGIYINTDAAGFANAAPNTGSWTVEFWSGTASAPLTRLYTTQVDAAAVQRTATTSRTFANTLVDEYEFALDLATPFDVDSNETYWFSVVSTSSSFTPFFSWIQGQGGGSAAQVLYDGSGQQLAGFERGGNRAFALEGQTVPLPGTAALLLAALGAAGWQRRRSR